MHGTHDGGGAVLVTGATGTVGRDVVRFLARSPARVLAAHRRVPGGPPPAGAGAGAPRVVPVRFDYTDRSSWTGALHGVDRVLLVRPPEVSDVGRDVVPFLQAARAAGVRHVVLLSVQGADRVPVLPHARLERWLRGSGLAWTFLRPSFFVQNLTGVHAPDVVAGRLVLPAGRGRTAFVDARDVAEVAAHVLLDPGAHAGRVWTPTGPEALTYDEVAAVLGAVLGDPARVRYVPVGLARYARHAHDDLGMTWPMVAVTCAIYTSARLGLAAGLTDDVRAVTGRPPASLHDVAARERGSWEPAHASTTGEGS